LAHKGERADEIPEKIDFLWHIAESKVDFAQSAIDSVFALLYQFAFKMSVRTAFARSIAPMGVVFSGMVIPCP
jgi:hypothetical protein